MRKTFVYYVKLILQHEIMGMFHRRRLSRIPSLVCTY